MRGELVGLGLREIALGLDDEEARRHPHLEPLALGVEPLVGEFAGGAGRLHALRVHFDVPARVRTSAESHAPSALFTRSSACTRSSLRLA